MHLARSAPEEDHHCVIAAALRPSIDWRRPPGRPRSTWLRVTDEDVQPQNFGVHMAWRKAKDRDTWQQVVSMATLCKEFATKKKNNKAHGWTYEDGTMQPLWTSGDVLPKLVDILDPQLKTEDSEGEDDSSMDETDSSDSDTYSYID